MKCKKCDSDLDELSKFCNKCGAKIEKEKSTDIHEVCKAVAKLWFRIGFIRGSVFENRKGLPEVKKLEKDLKDCGFIWDWYKEILAEINTDN